MSFHNSTRGGFTARRLVTIGLLVALAIALSAVERLIPLPMAIPGFKLGLANMVTLTALYLLTLRDALTVVLVRVLLGALVLGSFSSFLFSAGGALVAYGVMALLIHRFPRVFSIVGVSVCGAVGHNLGQLAVAAAVLQNPGVLSYLPVLMGAAVATGLLVGLTVRLLLKHLRHLRTI